MTRTPETKLTKRQEQVLDLIRSEIEKNGYPPSVREIGEKLGLKSSATVHAHLETLEAKGYLHREGAKSRTITLSEKAGGESAGQSPTSASPTIIGGNQSNITNLPLVGSIAAGAPILAEQNIEETISLPTAIVGDTSSFLLKVKGESMIEAGILDGDYVVVKEQQDAPNGTIVAALLDNEATVKVLYKEKDCTRLQPCNESMEPIYSTNVSIMGVVVALFRTL